MIIATSRCSKLCFASKRCSLQVIPKTRQIEVLRPLLLLWIIDSGDSRSSPLICCIDQTIEWTAIYINAKVQDNINFCPHYIKISHQMMFYKTFYESIFLQQFSMKLLGLPTKKHFFCFILGCPHDFNFAWPFWYGQVVTGLNGRNDREKIKSCGHPRMKLKKCFAVGRPKSFIENCSKKINS